MSGPTGSSWNQQHSDQDLSRAGASRESVSGKVVLSLACCEFVSLFLVTS